ncbi:hypothetical protein PPUJ20028_46940 [Pseudomonas putida]|uniref:Uncharacterized protein n=1 Tax=Pseudomonas putida TaxID=303 RepID=A0AA37VPF2_PSEPU|nr:hypothetical protein [Pseudomonas putida]GLO16108.1 hypothetical protein PPUJ20028_46940 [Pseudomonas putida]GLO37833.1 hypothetical protein PPUN14671_46700 [Pseudomonas putida]HDS0965055.1 hypothetical protein [Pseudomonas putida]HDS0991437.1 hypothetical protein [Pseudomonas putida]
MSIRKEFLPGGRQGESNAWSREQHGLKTSLSADEINCSTSDIKFFAIVKTLQGGVESRRLTRHTPGELFDKLSADLSVALDLLSLSMGSIDAAAISKLLYVHAVNLIESLMMSILSKAVASSPGLRGGFEERFLEGGLSSGLHEAQRKILSGERGVLTDINSGLDLKGFRNFEYLLIEIFGGRLEGLNFALIDRVFTKRDYLLNCDGVSVEGQLVQLAAEEVELVIVALRDFAVDLNVRIYHSLFEHDSPAT